MDNLTHSLIGAVLGQCGLKKKTGLAMPALIIGANLPDVDVTCFAWTTGLEHLAFRRGITHGPPALVILPLVLAVALTGGIAGRAGAAKTAGRRCGGAGTPTKRCTRISAAGPRRSRRAASR